MKRTILMLVALLAAGINAYSQEVTVIWKNETAEVIVSENILPLVIVEVNGADVSVEQDASVAQEITYHLSGQSGNGSFTLTGEHKITLSLEGLQLTSKAGSAINIKNGKRIAVVSKDSTENMLTDKDGGDQKACMMVKGHVEFQGDGTLTINARGRHGLKVKEYVEMKSGTLNITTTGSGYWDVEDQKTKASACINTDENVIINGGTLNLLSTGDGGKGINCDSTFTMNGGTLTARTVGARYIYENYDGNPTNIDAIPDSLKNSPKAVKADMGICINGGTLNLYTEQDGGEGMESKDTLVIHGGSLHIETFDDCINAAGNVRIHGGDLFLNSLDNDGIDTNQSMFITGGHIVTLGNHLHQLGIDVNDKSPYKKLYLTGGTIVCVGGTSQVSHPFACEGAQPALYYKGKLNVGTELTLRFMDDGSEVMNYSLQRDYTAEAGGIQPELCIMLSSPKLIVGMGYELIDETTGNTLAAVNSLSELYSDMGVNEACFSRESFTLGHTTLPYRKAEICHDGTTQPALVLYLHGGSSRGSDNEAQLQEKAVSVIYQYILNHNLATTFIVPQCPLGGGWTSQNRKVVNELLQTYVQRGEVASDRVYILGGSMGGTGTWCQLSYFPDFYAAAMPVAGNPTGMNAANVATTPVLTVMGTADAMMSIDAVKNFQTDVIAVGGSLQLDIEEGWSHPTTCEQSYTDGRLAWLFSQVRNSETGIRITSSASSSPSIVHDLNGRPLSHSVSGINIKEGKKYIQR